MFIDFFYYLRLSSFKVSIEEWLTLMDALTMGLHQNSFYGFYKLCQAVLVKTEADYDLFEQLFLDFFFQIESLPDIHNELLQWLNAPSIIKKNQIGAVKYADGEAEKEEILRSFYERAREQKKEHNGGCYWIGTQGNTNYGNMAFEGQGIRVGGKSTYKSAFEVIGKGMYRDFRKDAVLNVRSFQTAFRMLRQYTSQNQNFKREFDIDQTIRKTCDNAGILHISYKNPRKNNVRVLLLMDSGGSMEYYSNLCSTLFQALNASNHFRELNIYYFHNCIGSVLYSDPSLERKYAVSTELIMKRYSDEYKVIIAGDALMAPDELMEKRYDAVYSKEEMSGFDWLMRMKKRYPYLVWLNPEKEIQEGYWGESYRRIARIINMYSLTVEGIEYATKFLLYNQKGGRIIC